MTVIINAYRPPRGDPVEAQSWLDYIIQNVTLERYADVYLLGDLNLDHTTAKCSAQTKNLHEPPWSNHTGYPKG